MFLSRLAAISLLAVLIFLGVSCAAKHEHAAAPPSAPHDERFLIAMLDHHREGDRMIVPYKDKTDMRS